MAAAASSPKDAPAGGQSFGTPGYRLYVLILLMLVYTLNFIDRSLLGVVSQPIITEFGLSDTQFGFLNGPPFALFYALMGIPIAMAADRFNRVAIIAFCIAIWSLMTALCGLATSFAFLLLFRVGVAIGEAGGTPPSNSLIGDYFKPRSRAAALGVFGMGVTIGTALANAFGGPIASLKGADFGVWLHGIGLSAIAGQVDWSTIDGWRIAFVLIGVPGVIIAIVVALTIKEPPRGYSDPPGTPKQERATIGDTFRELFAKPTFWTMAFGAALVAFVGYGHFSFQAPMAQRIAGIGPREFALEFGVPLALIAAVGTFLGGWLTERWSARFAPAAAVIPGIGLLASIPCYIIAFNTIDQDWERARIFWGAASLFHYAYLSAQYSIGQGVVSARSRAAAIAILLFTVALIGNGIGPQAVGILSDMFMAQEIQKFGAGMDLTNAICRARDLSGLSAEAQAVCKSAYGEGLRQSMIAVTYVFGVAALFYFLAGVTLKKDMVAKTH